MEQTLKIYNSKGAYERRGIATVLSCRQDEKGYAVVLDATVFFPESGGQSSDVGEIFWEEKNENGTAQRVTAYVTDVQISNEIITHWVDKEIPNGQTVEMEIDWNHRFSNMQQHTGEHVFSGLVHKRYGYNNVGFHLSNQIVTMDYDGSFTEEQISELELAVNGVIAENVPVFVLYPSVGELSAMEYRSKKELEGEVRIVEVAGYDVCACCAPHVRSTAEIGIFKIMSAQNYKGGTRISFLCGLRAFKEYQKKSGIITELSNILTTNQEQLAENVAKLKAQNQTLKQKLASAKQELMQHKINGIPTEQSNVILFEEELDTPVARAVVNSLAEKHNGVCAVFLGNDRNGYQFVLGSQSKDCRTIAAKLKDTLGARGGGSEKMIQGSLDAAAEEIKRILS